MLKMFSTGQILTQTNLLLRKSYVSYPEPDKPQRVFKFGGLYLWSSLISYYQSCSHFELQVPAVKCRYTLFGYQLKIFQLSQSAMMNFWKILYQHELLLIEPKLKDHISQ